MFCCISSPPPVGSQKHPGFTENLSVLCLSSKAPDMAEICSLETPTRTVRVYHVKTLSEFKNAFLGCFFKARVYPEDCDLRLLPRAFHAIVIKDWPGSTSKIRECIAQIQETQSAVTSWRQGPLYTLAEARKALALSSDFFISLEEPWKKDLTHRLLPKAPLLVFETDKAPCERPFPWIDPAIAHTSSTSIAATGTLKTGISATSLTVSPAGALHTPFPAGFPIDASLSPVRTPEVASISTLRPSTVVVRYLIAPIASADPAKEVLRGLASLAQGPAERASVSIHQNALLEAFSLDRLLHRGMSLKSAQNFRLALVYSDMGKISYYKEWYKTESEDSTALFNALQLKSESPLSKLLGELSQGKPYLNPELSHEQLRLLFTSVPSLVGYFHEFQGMRVAERRLIAGDISGEEFREIILGFYGHNGPGDFSFAIAGERPFWALLPNLILSHIETLISEGTLPKIARRIFAGTSFSQIDGSLKYHDPRTYLGVEHALYDRFDGYRDSTKIREEISFLPPINAEVESLLGPNYNTRLAMIYNEKVLLPRMLREGLITQIEHDRLVCVCQKLKERVEFIHTQITERILNWNDLESALREKRPLESITVFFDGAIPSAAETRTFTKKSLGNWDSQAAKFFREFMDLHVRKAVRELDLDAHGIYNDFCADL